MGQTQKGIDQGLQLCLGVAEKLLAPEILKRPDVSKRALAQQACMSRPTFYRHLQAMGLGEGGTPMSLEDRATYISDNFTVTGVRHLKAYALEKAFYRRKTVKRDYDNSRRAAKAKTLHRAKAKQTKNDTEVQAQANARLLAEVGALTGQKTTAPARKEVKATRALPFDPEGKIQMIIAPLTPHLTELIARYFSENVTGKHLSNPKLMEIFQSPTSKAAEKELRTLEETDPRVNLEKWAVWYYITCFAGKEVRDQIAQSLRIGHFNGVPDEKKWAFPLFRACQGLGIKPEWL